MVVGVTLLTGCFEVTEYYECRGLKGGEYSYTRVKIERPFEVSLGEKILAYLGPWSANFHFDDQWQEYEVIAVEDDRIRLRDGWGYSNKDVGGNCTAGTDTAQYVG